MKLGMIRQPNAESFDYLKNKGLEFMEVCCNFDPESHSFIDNVADIKANIVRTLEFRTEHGRQDRPRFDGVESFSAPCSGRGRLPGFCLRLQL